MSGGVEDVYSESTCIEIFWRGCLRQSRPFEGKICTGIAVKKSSIVEIIAEVATSELLILLCISPIFPMRRSALYDSDEIYKNRQGHDRFPGLRFQCVQERN